MKLVVGGPRCLLLCVSMVIVAFAVSACGSSFDSAASGEHLIKNTYKSGQITVKSVKCPSGVKKKVGNTYDCKVTLHSSVLKRDGSGTITIHVLAGDRVGFSGQTDVHVQ